MSERAALKEKLDNSTGKAWEYYETVSGKYIVREDDGDDAGALAHFESADDAAFVCSAKNVTAALLSELEQAERERETFRKDAKTWEGSFRMYRDAWIRELGGWLVPKSHEIDSLVLTMRKRVKNPLLGNCSIPHWLGKPTTDGKALQQTPHPRDSDCREWKADDSEPNPRAEASEAALRTLRQASRAVSQKVNNAVFVTELKEEINTLRLAAEGGK